MCFFSPQVIDIKALEAMNSERIAILNRELLQLKEKMVRKWPCFDAVSTSLCRVSGLSRGAAGLWRENSSTRLPANSRALKYELSSGSALCFVEKAGIIISNLCSNFRSLRRPVSSETGCDSVDPYSRSHISAGKISVS
jgi:hypothetical protein